MPAKPPAKWKMALTTWVALLPMVVALGYIFGPFRLPVLLAQALSTIIPVVMLTWVVMPALTRLLHDGCTRGDDVTVSRTAPTLRQSTLFSDCYR